MWDMNSAMYRRKDSIQSVLEEVVREMALENFTAEDAKQKIKSLRGTTEKGVADFCNYFPLLKMIM
jgi:hypothetical protein